MLHILTNPLMIYFWTVYAVVLGMFWQKWGCACISYIKGEQAHPAFSLNGFIVVGMNSRRAGMLYGVQFGR